MADSIDRLIGERLVRVSGEKYQIGNLGTAVQTQGDRVRVMWDARGSQKAKRTWVHRSVVKPA